VKQWINPDDGNVFAGLADVIEAVRSQERAPWGRAPAYELVWKWRRWRERVGAGGDRRVEDDELGQLLLKRLSAMSRQETRPSIDADQRGTS